jgi:aspartate racemase
MAMLPDGSVPSVLAPHPLLLNAAKQLGALADFLVIPSNTPHLFLDAIEQAAGRPVLDMVELTVQEIERHSPGKVGILAIGHALDHRLFQERLDAAGIAWQTIDTALSRRLTAVILAFMEGRVSYRSRLVIKRAIEHLRSTGAERIILGCSELPLLLPRIIDAAVLVDPCRLLAEEAVARASR